MLSDNEMDNLIKPEKGKKVKLKRVKLDRDKAKEKEEKKKAKLEKKANKGKKSKKEKNGEKPKKKKKLFWRIFKVFFFVGLALFVIGCGVVLYVLNDIISETSTVDYSQLKNLKLTTTILDSKGNQLGTVNSGENRLMADYEELPQHLIDAVVAIEDERFWTHFGVDIKRTGAAIVTFVLNRGSSSFGGSTITQQLVKNITEDNEGSWKRKIREWYRSIMLEKNLEKEDILEAYLNKIYFGEGANGIEMAAQTFFAKTVADLNLAESACLAASIQLPEVTNPYNGEKNKEKLIDRQKVVLNKMLSIGKITQEEYDEAISYELVFKKGKIASTSAVQSYARDAVWKAVAEDLAEAMNITYQAARDMVASNGYTIYATIDPTVQASIDKQAANTKYFYKDKKKGMMQCAMIVLDNKTGNVVGMLGGVGEKTGLDYNRATESKLQPGSTFKPIAAYGPAFELGESYPGMGIDDVPVNFGGYKPTNWYGYYYGYVSVREAINQSMNIPAVKTLKSIDLGYALRFAQSMGITTLTEKANKNLSLALGSANVKVIDMAAAYATMANGGVYTEPKLYTKVLDHEGKEVLVNKVKFTKVMSETTAYMLTDCLRSVVSSGTGTSAKFSTKIQIAGKTGNTNDDKDQWFAGYTPYYTAVVWNGYDKPTTIGSRKTLGTYPYTATVVWTNVMKTIHKNLKAASFSKPKGIVKATVCTLSGLVATDACRAYEKNVVKTEIFASGTVPTAECEVHKLVKVCKTSKLLPTEYCELYEELVEISTITREKPKTKTSDRKYIAPTETCTLHTSAPVVEEPVVPETPVDPENPGTTPENPGTTPENPGTTPENPGTTPETPTPENPGTTPETPTTPGTGEQGGTTQSLAYYGLIRQMLAM